MSQTESGWSKVVGEKPKADSRDAPCGFVACDKVAQCDSGLCGQQCGFVAFGLCHKMHGATVTSPVLSLIHI